MPTLLRPLCLSISSLCCAAAAAAPMTLTVQGADGTPLQDAVVAVIVKGTPARAAAGTVVEMAQRGRRFVPAVLAVQTGTAVNFPNFDTVRHHVYSFSPIKTFEIKLYAGTPAEPVVFDKPGTATLGCNIHDTMTAFVHVVDTPYFGRTGALGQVEIDLPPGEHRLQLWHPSVAQPTTAPPLQPLTMGQGPLSLTLTLQTAGAP